MNHHSPHFCTDATKPDIGWATAPRGCGLRVPFVLAVFSAGLIAACGHKVESVGVQRENTVPIVRGAGAEGASTAGVLCSYAHHVANDSPSVMAISSAGWRCTDTSRVLVANGVPDHAVGRFPNAGNPNLISAQSVSFSTPLAPRYSGVSTRLGGPSGAIGFVINGVKIDAGTAGACPSSTNSLRECDLGRGVGPWRIEALGQSSFNFGTDSNNAHVQPTGAYHYHGIPEGFVAKLGGGPNKMTLIAWAADGFPVYARFGYSVATEAVSALRVISGSYKLRTAPRDDRPAVTLIPMGALEQDWEYVAGSGDLDECNGRVGITPEFPRGIYHYYATDSYPYFQRCVKGVVDASVDRPGRGPPEQQQRSQS